MKQRKAVVLILVILGWSFALAFAGQQTPEERGKTHFDNPSFAGGKKSCSNCHPDGRDLVAAGTKTAFHIMGGVQNSLEEAINVCIVNANKGHAIDVNSVEMQELVSYIKSLGAQKTPGDTK
jgi:cytochrome c